MSDQQLDDPLLRAVREARPAIDDALVSHTSADALKVLERVLDSGEARRSPRVEAAHRRATLGGRFRLERLAPLLGATASAAVVAAIFVFALGLHHASQTGTTSSSGLLDRAVAAIDVGGHEVLHELDIQSEGGLPGYSTRVEGWLLPADGRARVIEIWGYARSPFVHEWIITATGRAFGRVCLANCHPAAFIKGRLRWAREGGQSVGSLSGPPMVPGTLALRFRAAYRAHALVRAGTTTFAGRRVAQFQTMDAGVGTGPVFWRPGTEPPAKARATHLYALTAWYVDTGTASLLGYAAWGCQNTTCHTHGGPDSITRIVTFQRLAPTAENIARLTGPNAPADAR